MKWSLFFVTSICSCSLDGSSSDSDPDAVLLGPGAGVMIAESSGSLDGAALESILPGTHRRVRVEGLLLGPDMQLRRLVDAGGREHLYTVHSDQGAVVERDREGHSLTRWDVYDKARGASSANPLDVALGGDGTLWITRHGERSLVVIEADGKTQSTVDLAAFADDDGMPDMSAIAVVGDTAFVALRRLEKGFGTRKNVSTVVSIDVKTRVASAFLELPAKDPGPRFLSRSGALWISCIGGPLLKDALGNPDPDTNAGVVRIDLAARTAKVAFSAEAAKGFVTAFDLVDDQNGYAVVGEFSGDNPTSVVHFDPSTGKLLATWAKTSGYKLWDLVAMTNASGQRLLLVADRTEDNPGLRILSADDGARLGTLPSRLLPIQTVVLPAGT